MFDGLFKSILAMLDITPEEAKHLAHDTVNRIQSVDERLARIERALKIEGENNDDDTSGIN